MTKNLKITTTFNLKNSKREKFVLLTLCGLMLLAISKDLIHSFIKGYSFYLSESMLFGVFWLLFVPFCLVNTKLLGRYNQTTYFVFPFIYSFFHLFIFSLLVFTISGLFLDHTFGIVRVFTKTFADHSLTCLIFYGMLVFIFPKIRKPDTETRNNPKKIKVAHQNKVVLLACEDILYVKTERPYVALVTQNRTYLHNSTLKDFIEEHLTDNFVQIHKSTIVNMDYVNSYQSRKNGDYDVFMLNGDTLRVSRNFNSDFKSFSKVTG